jgi:tetratricopeptide (TPR) repeat protein
MTVIKETVLMKNTLVCLLLTAALTCSLGASITGRVEGLVTDNAGTPLEKVAISIVPQLSSALKFEIFTDQAGKFVQIGIQPGYYMISFKKEGFMPVSQEVHVAIQESTKLAVKLEKAQAVLERAVSESDKLFLKGNALYQDKKYEEALIAYQEAIARSDTQWGYHLNLGLTYKKLEKKDEAKTAFAKAVELNPDSYSANKEYGEALAKDGCFEEAKKYYQKAADLSPQDPDALYSLGACLSNLHETEAALAAFQKSIALKSDYADAYYQIGTLYINLNKKAEAIANLEKFLELAPAHEKAALAKEFVDYLKK